jgi:hypothetical protein
LGGRLGKHALDTRVVLRAVIKPHRRHEKFG